MSPYSSTSPHSLAHLIARQSIADEARQTLGSWDSCMSKAYCKWPVIVVIILGALIVLSIVICIARCCCCGLECCCACCSCFNRCCPSPRRKEKTQYVQAPQYPQQQYGYTPQMAYGGPQFATYDVSKNGKVKEDALPAMPSWETSQTHHVRDTSAEENAQKELGQSNQNGIAMGAIGGRTPRMRDDDPVYHEDDQLQPMLAEKQRPISPYAAPQPEDPYAQSYDYNDRTPYAPSSVGGSVRGQNPQHNYDEYSQDTHPAFRTPQSPASSSVYTSQYPQQNPSRAPTYRSAAPTYHSQVPAQHSVVTPTSPNGGYGNIGYADFSRSDTQSTRYEPTRHEPDPYSGSAELPGSLSIGGGGPAQQSYGHQQQYNQSYGQSYEMGGGQGIQRKPVG